ncbi:molybdopterin-dependent oxidoreductase [Sagittula salina]|nr:molybdopterin-dependent oxidoreductase [Sagittula salina]
MTMPSLPLWKTAGPRRTARMLATAVLALGLTGLSDGSLWPGVAAQTAAQPGAGTGVAAAVETGARTQADTQQATLPSPKGRVLLTISGAIGVTNGDGVARFDLAMLRDLGESTFATETIWTPGMRRFSGVQLKDLLEAVEAEGTTIEAFAINDYRVEIPVADAVEGGPIIAYEMDGALMSRREKGPLWVLYPFSSSGDYRTEVIYSRSIWQLDRMIVQK